MPSDNPLAEMSADELYALRTLPGEACVELTLNVWAEIRRRLELLAKFEAALERHGYTIARTILDLDRQ